MLRHSSPETLREKDLNANGHQVKLITETDTNVNEDAGAYSG